MTENHSESTEKKERTEIFSPGGVDYDHYIIFEQVLYHGGPAYARSDEPAVFERAILPGKDDPSLDKSTKPFRVLDGELPWKPASEPESYRDEASLFKDVREFLDRFIDFKDPRLYDIVAAWIMTTWRIEDWRVAGPLYLLGPINSGKTVCLECLEELAYRAVRSGSMSTAVMFRLSDSFHPNILVDEAQIYNQEEWGE